MEMEYCVLWVTCPDLTSANNIATALVEAHLAACVNIMPGIQSIYRWEGAVQSASEIMLMIKTVREKMAMVEAKVLSLHPYSVPEVIAMPITEGHAPYLHWIMESVLKSE